MSVPAFIVFKMATFLLIYGLTFGLVSMLNSSRARVLVGN
jgi:hypothetical protein